MLLQSDLDPQAENHCLSLCFRFRVEDTLQPCSSWCSDLYRLSINRNIRMTEALRSTPLFPAGEVQVARFLGISLTDLLLGTWPLADVTLGKMNQSYFAFFSPPKPFLEDGTIGPYFFKSIKT